MRREARIRQITAITVLSVALLSFAAVLIGPSAAASSSAPALLVGDGVGEYGSSWKDENIDVLFSIAGGSAYIRVTNKTAYVIRLQWPEASLRLPDGKTRTACFVHEYEAISRYYKPTLEKPNLSDADWRLLSAACNEDLFIKAGRTIFLELGVRIDNPTIPLQVGGKYFWHIKEEEAAKADSLYNLLSRQPEGSAVKWLLQYDFSGKAFVKEAHLKLAN